MGGFVSSAVGALVKRVPAADTRQILTRTLQTLEDGMSKTSAGQDMVKLLKDQYIPALHQARTSLYQAASQAAKHMQPAPAEIESQARNIARNHALGANDYRGVGLIKAIDKEPGMNPQQKQLAKQTLADHVHMFLKDTVDTTDNSDISAKPKWQQKEIRAKTNIGNQSKFKQNVNDIKKFPDTASRVNAGAIYNPPHEWERKAVSFASKVMLPAIAIPHIGTLFNYALNTPTRDLVHGLAEATFSNNNVRRFATDSGVFASTIADAYAVRHYGQRGIIARATGSDQFGVIVNQLTHQPGFNPLREWTISIGAATGKHMAERLSEEFAQSRGRATDVGFQLKRMGLDPKDILQQGGKLNPDQLRKAIFNYVDNKAFLDNSMHRSINSGAYAISRLSLLYHGYVTRQGQLIGDVLKNDIAQHKGGYANAAKALAMLGIVFPTVGTGLETLERYGRGQHENTKEDFENLSGKNGGAKMAEQWIEGQAHMAAFGTVVGYARASARHKLAEQMVGPIGNEVINLGQDAVAAGMGGSAKPLGRDVLEDTIPDNLGKIIAHKYLPTKKEEKEAAGGSSKLKKLKGVGGLKKLKGVS